MPRGWKGCCDVAVAWRLRGWFWGAVARDRLAGRRGKERDKGGLIGMFPPLMQTMSIDVKVRRANFNKCQRDRGKRKNIARDF
jgi:hypothetical protein